MNLQQLQYIVSVDEHRHFQKAANSCYITPATLSMMIKKLEEELNVVLFDRSKNPIETTDIGKELIDKAKLILSNVEELKSIAKSKIEDISGLIRIGIIPTIAPYLIYLFLPQLLKDFPTLKVKLYEWNTEEILKGLKHNRIDIGIASTPLNDKEINETFLYNEPFYAYSTFPKTSNKKYITPKDIKVEKLWLLEEEHCFRSQVENLCQLRKNSKVKKQLDFEAGTIESIIHILNVQEGITIIPALSIPTLKEENKKNILAIKHPIPVRTISLLSHQYFYKKQFEKVLSTYIKRGVSQVIKQTEKNYEIIQINK